MAKLVRLRDGMSRLYLPEIFVPSPNSEGDTTIRIARFTRLAVALGMLLVWGLLPVAFLSRSYIFPPELAAVTSFVAEVQQGIVLDPNVSSSGPAPAYQKGDVSLATPLPAQQSRGFLRPRDSPAAGFPAAWKANDFSQQPAPGGQPGGRFSATWQTGDSSLPSNQPAPPQPGQLPSASAWPGQQRQAPFDIGAHRSKDPRFRKIPIPRDTPAWPAGEPPSHAQYDPVSVEPMPVAPASPVAPLPVRPVSVGGDLKARCGELAILPLPLPPPPAVFRGRKPPPPPKSLLPRLSPDERRLLIVSTGGVGTSALISEMMPALEGHGVGVVFNDVNDFDGLKHAWLSECTLQRVRRFGPTAILYVLGEPAAATYAHFRRGWAGAQMCKLAQGAEASLLAPGLGAALLLNAKPQRIFKTSAATSWAHYVRWVDTQGPLWRDPMGYAEHARSWQQGAAELGAPIWFSSLADLVADAYPLPLLLDFPSNATANRSRPLFSLSLREPSYRPDGLPKNFLEAYEGVSAELSKLRGRCYEPMPAGGAASSRCAAAGLPTTLLDPPALSIFKGLGTGAAGGDPAYQFFEHTQVREGSECWKLMKPRTAWRPTRLPS